MMMEVNMKGSTLRFVFVISTLIIIVGTISRRSIIPSAQAAGTQASFTIPEGRDFATLTLHDPWDMTEYSDISQFLNNSNQENLLTNIGVQNGLFSAQGVANDPWFSVLFQGYGGAMLIGKVGARYPIDQNTYRCLYLAANISNGGTGGQVYWFRDETYTADPSKYGVKSFIVSSGIWNLYKLDLATHDALAPWSTGPWRGLRIDPSNANAATFIFDWVRLTDCSPRNISLTGLPGSAPLDFYLGTASGELFVTSITPNSGNATVDLQGVAPGAYTYSVKNSGSAVQTGTVTVTQTPVANFVRPSFISGQDYGVTAGDPWDFGNPNDVGEIFDFASYSIQNGVITLITNSGTNVDARIELNVPLQITENPNPYRYLSFRMNTADAIQNVTDGMIVRWIWRRPGPGPADCYLVSLDIPYDVGWQTYSIDLYNPANGTAIGVGGSCSGVSTTWQNNPQPVIRMRFDPNENVLGHPLTQQIDWIKLTQVDRVPAGTPFPIQISLNQPVASVPVRNFYYTDDLNNPTKFVAAPYNAPPPTGPFSVYLPSVLRNFAAAIDALPVPDLTYLWNTTGVAPGTYYTCVHVEDAGQTNSANSTYCSEAPVIVR
jgi:hypothetical protein